MRDDRHHTVGIDYREFRASLFELGKVPEPAVEGNAFLHEGEERITAAGVGIPGMATAMSAACLAAGKSG